MIWKTVSLLVCIMKCWPNLICDPQKPKRLLSRWLWRFLLVSTSGADQPPPSGQLQWPAQLSVADQHLTTGVPFDRPNGDGDGPSDGGRKSSPQPEPVTAKRHVRGHRRLRRRGHGDGYGQQGTAGGRRGWWRRWRWHNRGRRRLRHCRGRRENGPHRLRSGDHCTDYAGRQPTGNGYRHGIQRQQWRNQCPVQGNRNGNTGPSVKRAIRLVYRTIII